MTNQPQSHQPRYLQLFLTQLRLRRRHLPEKMQSCSKMPISRPLISFSSWLSFFLSKVKDKKSMNNMFLMGFGKSARPRRLPERWGRAAAMRPQFPS
jgi:hypothetical protein